MQRKENCPGRSNNDGKDCQGPQHASCDLSDLRHEDDEVYEVSFIRRSAGRSFVEHCL